MATNSPLRYQHVKINNQELALRGKAPAQVDLSYYIQNKEPILWEDPVVCKDKRYELRVKAISLGGSVQTDTSGISVCGATEVVLLLSVATSLNGFDKCPEKEGYAKRAQEPGLESLYFQFGHYLLISSSRLGVRQPTCKACGTISCGRPGAPYHQHQRPDELLAYLVCERGGL